jgi:hypothetical protein
VAIHWVLLDRFVLGLGRLAESPWFLVLCPWVVPSQRRRVMRLESTILKRVSLLALLCVPVAVWAFVKPVHLLAPSLVGVTCISDVICTDTPSRSREVTELYDEALGFVETKVAPIKSRPHVVFCQSDTCAQSFGLGRSTAKTTDPFGIVYGPRAWTPYYVRHEFIHHLQYERLGIYRFHRSPAWFIEGMAYSLSEDPRTTLAEPFEQYRSHFEAWLRSVGKEHLWEQARKL